MRDSRAIVQLTLILLCLLVNHVHCHFLRTPENVAGRIGEVVAMNCASNDTSRSCGNLVWARQNSKTSEQIDISMQDPVTLQSRVSRRVSNYTALTDSSNGNCNLNITIRESAEGTYECIEADTTKAVTAQLIILEDEPECLVRTDDKVFNISCSVRFLGSWSPTMRWFQVIGTNSLPIEASEFIISGQIVSSTALLKRVNISDETGHKTLGLRCSVNFSEDRRPDRTSATNVPDYVWTSPIFGGGGGGNEKKLDDTSNDRPETNNVPYGYIAGIVILVVALVIVVILYAHARHRLTTKY